MHSLLETPAQALEEDCLGSASAKPGIARVMSFPSQALIVVEHKQDWESYLPSDRLISVYEYLEASEKYISNPHLQIINLCRSYRYLENGYYCSLLAEARGQKVIPSVRTLNELAGSSIYRSCFDVLEKGLDQVLDQHAISHKMRFSLTLCFGQSPIQSLQALAWRLFKIFPCPILHVDFSKEAGWRIAGVRPGALHKLKASEQHDFANALGAFNRRIWQLPPSRSAARYDLAILHDPREVLPPSNAQALERFVRVGAQMGLNVELIGKKDYSRLAEYDALFIRETTRVDHHTYRFARKGESEGLVVMDDSSSILRCSNKVYLTDLLKRNALSMPGTEVLYRDHPEHLEKAARTLGFPMVLKIPDGCFSHGVVRVASVKELVNTCQTLFERSALLLAQEFLYTEYDWRIGVLNGQPIYACQYFMSSGHWQIYHHQSSGISLNGECCAVHLQDVPAQVVETAVRAARQMGDGLYGVDLKQCHNRVVVIEVNDNPNLDAGVEDACLGDDLYRTVLKEFVRRLELKRLGHSG